MLELETTVDEDDLRADFQDGLAALRQRCPKAVPVEDTGNHVVVYLGPYSTDEYEVPYEDDEYHVFARIQKQFPKGDTKGFVTVPPLSRESGAVNNNDWHVEAEDVVKQATGEQAESYSYDWSEVEMSSSRHMANADTLARNFLSYG